MTRTVMKQTQGYRKSGLHRKQHRQENSLGSSPIEFIRKLPDYVGNPHPDADEVLQALENIREDHGVQRYGICFPEGYANRKERRRQEKEARRQARKELSQYGR